MKTKSKKQLSGREKHRRHKQSQAQWEKDNAAAAHGLKQLASHGPQYLIGRSQ